MQRTFLGRVAPPAQRNWARRRVVAWALAVASCGVAQAQAPEIHITTVPAYGTSQLLRGTVANVDPAEYKVNCYLFLDGQGWWVKPTLASPCVTIDSDSTWSANVVTGGCDAYAIAYKCFLLPVAETCPTALGTCRPPEVLDDLAVATDFVERHPFPIDFAGYTWDRKDSRCLAGPGPNYFDPNNVFVDANGHLHLRIAFDGSKWEGAELWNQTSLGYGEYRVLLSSRVDVFDPWVVHGQFTWDNYGEDACSMFNRELDLEFSRWGDANAFENAQFVVQPFTDPDHLHKFRVDLTDAAQDLTYILDWRPGRGDFCLYHGHHLDDPPEEDLVDCWEHGPEWIPNPADERYRMNLWLFNSQPPAGTAEVVVPDFRYTPKPVVELDLPACPGPGAVDLSGLTPGGDVALMAGVAEGETVIPGGPCPGIVLGLDRPRLLSIVTADAEGKLQLAPFFPDRACGTVIQATDLATCETSNTAAVPGGS